MIGKIKSLLVAHAVFVGMFAYATVEDQGASLLPVGIFGAIPGAFCFPFVLSFIVRLNIATGYYSPPFTVPKWGDNLFNLKDPMPFLQFGYVYFAGFGCGAVVSAAWRGVDSLPWILISCAGALGFYLGFRRIVSLYCRES